MGVIKKEGIKQSIASYIGVLIGVINTMYFYPKFFIEEELGLFRFLIDTATLLFPFISLGVHNLSVRMFPTFKNSKNGHNGLLYFLLVGVIIGYAIFLIGVFIISPFIEGLFESKSILIQENWNYVVPIAGLMVFSTIFTLYILNFKKVLLPTIINQLSIKIVMPTIAVLLYFDYVSILEGVYIMIGVFVLRAIALAGYIAFLKEWHWKPNWQFLKKPLRKEMAVYSMYGVLGSLGGIMATRIDIFMLAILATNDLKDVGVYSIAMFMANVITIPEKSINNISSPIISESWKTNDIENIKTIYSKSSIVLLTLGLFFLVGIWSSVDDLFAIMPNGEKFAGGKYVILILGIGKLFNLASGTNSNIIGFSKHFRYNFYAVLILAVINVISNFVFIPIYQINGAALATACSLLIFNLFKFSFVYFKMGMQPFSISSLKVLAIAGVVYVLGIYISPTGIPVFDMVIRSVFIGVVFISSVIYFKVSEDITSLFWQMLDKVNVFKKR